VPLTLFVPLSLPMNPCCEYVRTPPTSERKPGKHNPSLSTCAHEMTAAHCHYCASSRPAQTGCCQKEEGNCALPRRRVDIRAINILFTSTRGLHDVLYRMLCLLPTPIFSAADGGRKLNVACRWRRGLPRVRPHRQGRARGPSRPIVDQIQLICLIASISAASASRRPEPLASALVNKRRWQ
jgi:hypothetical protein